MPTAKANSITNAKNRTKAMRGLKLKNAKTDAIKQIAAKTNHTTTSSSRAIDIYIHPKQKKRKISVC